VASLTFGVVLQLDTESQARSGDQPPLRAIASHVGVAFSRLAFIGFITCVIVPAQNCVGTLSQDPPMRLRLFFP
jgi:hypothetical protein